MPRRSASRLTGEQLQVVFEQFKLLADKKKEIYDGDIMALVQQQISGSVDEQWSLVDYLVTSGKTRSPHVELTLKHGEKEMTECVEQGDGPIDAAFWAVEKITGIELVCKDFRVRSATLGRDAIGEVNLEVEHKGRSYRGVGVSTDSVESTILAMLNAINRIVAEEPTQAGLRRLCCGPAKSAWAHRLAVNEGRRPIRCDHRATWGP